MATLDDVIEFLEDRYPPELAESWDSVGLICGDRQQQVRRIHLALDPTEDTVAEAIEAGADLLVTHHPLLLKPIHALTSDSSKGRVLRAAIGAELAIFNAHTNADRARDGVNDALAAAVGLSHTRPLVPANERRLEKVVVFVPSDDHQQLIDTLADAGAGALGNYSRCAFATTGIGTFIPGAEARPAIGEQGIAATVNETRVEMVYEAQRRSAVLSALRDAHPYEEPAFDILELQPLPTDQGLGRVGVLAEPVTLRAFAETVAHALPTAPVGVRVAGDLDRNVRTVAVLGGSGDGHFSDAARAGADVYLTADLRHHPASEHLADGGPALIDGGHWATESIWLPRLSGLLSSYFSEIPVSNSSICTDPWAAVIPGN